MRVCWYCIADSISQIPFESNNNLIAEERSMSDEDRKKASEDDRKKRQAAQEKASKKLQDDAEAAAIAAVSCEESFYIWYFLIWSLTFIALILKIRFLLYSYITFPINL